ncbi:carboxypeptidase regulatory-like domain-containing protein [Microbacterium jejuense]|uniref:alpha-amylase n=1 Tax=Microbacterium jejuense TaxID=1263637 RepID=A0ABS7HMW4_9MICO|nr:carboxypeptidase-like regulatory domain-containing protein [Microbacterium jejuense]MBW9094297.1 carboxypeptidase regulatory-like domain-containing protein [Microbacterium jejuense]
MVAAVAAAVVIGLVGGQPAAAVEPGSISGVVTVDGGAPVAGASVVAYTYNSMWGGWSWTTSTSTSPDGSYVVTGLADGQYKLQFQSTAPGSNIVSEYWQDAADLMSATTLTVSGGTGIDGIDPVLSVGATISGVVTDESGAPVQGVSVRATAVGGWTGSYGLTDAHGAYRVAALAAGSYNIEFTPLAGSGPVAGEWYDDAASQAEAAPVTVAAGGAATGIDAVLAPAGSIAGVVTDTTGAPTSYAYVGVYRATAGDFPQWVTSMSTDASGAYRVDGLAVGDYKVQFSAMNGLLGEWYDDAADAASATVVSVAGGATTTVDGELAIGATLTGVVTDEAGNPVSDVRVWAHPVEGEGFAIGGGSGSDGTYRIPGLPSGDYRVEFDTSATAASVVGEWWNDAKTEADASVVSVTEGTVVEGISAQLAEGAELSGVVRDGQGTPMASVQVSLRDPAGQWVRYTHTDMDGSYTIRGVDAGSYRLKFSAQVDQSTTTLNEWWNNAPDLTSADELVVTAATDISGLDVVLSVDDGSVIDTNSASLSGTVTDAAGNPLPNASVSVEGIDMGDGFQVMPDGTWSMTLLPAGPYRVSFSAVIDGTLVTEWWEDAADRGSATVIDLGSSEQRTGIDAVLGAALPPVESSVPKVTGPLRVGGIAKAHPRDWTDGIAFTYQWFADGAPIVGGTASSLPITPDLVGSRLTVAVTGSASGYQIVTRTSAPTTAVSRG